MYVVGRNTITHMENLEKIFSFAINIEYYLRNYWL